MNWHVMHFYNPLDLFFFAQYTLNFWQANMSKSEIQLFDIIIAVSAVSFGCFINEYLKLHEEFIQETNSLNITG